MMPLPPPGPDPPHMQPPTCVATAYACLPASLVRHRCLAAAGFCPHSPCDPRSLCPLFSHLPNASLPPWMCTRPNKTRPLCNMYSKTAAAVQFSSCTGSQRHALRQRRYVNAQAVNCMGCCSAMFDAHPSAGGLPQAARQVGHAAQPLLLAARLAQRPHQRAAADDALRAPGTDLLGLWGGAAKGQPQFCSQAKARQLLSQACTQNSTCWSCA